MACGAAVLDVPLEGELSQTVLRERQWLAKPLSVRQKPVSYAVNDWLSLMKLRALNAMRMMSDNRSRARLNQVERKPAVGRHRVDFQFVIPVHQRYNQRVRVCANSSTDRGRIQPAKPSTRRGGERAGSGQPS